MSKIVKQLFSHTKDLSEKTYTQDLIKDLPEPIQRYFRYVLQENQPFISSARLKHRGLFRPKDKWAKIRGKEYFSADKPGFVWIAKVPMIKALDRYVNGDGNLVIKLLSLFKVVDAKGLEINQGELLRWLAEIPLLPTALLPIENLKWEAIDNEKAKVIFTDHGVTVEGVFYVNDKGQITKFKAKRFKDTTLEDWTGYYNDYRNVDNIKVPFYMEVEWNLESGNHSYAKFTIDEIEFNKPFSY